MQTIGYESGVSPISPTDVILTLKNGSDWVVVGTATGISVSIDRRKIPLYALGYVDPMAIGRGTRLISGVIDFVVINLSAVKEIFDAVKGSTQIYITELEEDVREGMTNKQEQQVTLTSDTKVTVGYSINAQFLDELSDIDIYVYGVPEAPGNNKQAAYMKLVGVEFLSVDWALTMNDVAAAERATFIAKHWVPWQLTDLKASTGDDDDSE